MSEQVEQQLHREGRTLGHGFFDRILTMEKILGTVIVPEDINELDRREFNGNYYEAILEDINLVTAYGDQIVLMGERLKLPVISPEQQEHLAAGNTIVSYIETSPVKTLVLVTHPSTEVGKKHDSNLLLANPRQEYLYNFGILSPEIACALTREGEVLNCSAPVSDEEIANIDIENSGSQVRQWAYLNNPYSLYIWTLFARAQYAADDISIMLAVPESTSLNDINSFNTIFPKTLLITALIVVALSITAIRRYLDPLEQLVSGTKRIMNGIFNMPVSITSNDEFETLGNSFNDMSSRIDEQIQALTMMSRIDRMILASHDARQIIHVLIEYGHNVFTVDHIAVVTVNNDDMSKSSITYNRDNTFSTISTDRLVIHKQQFKIFDNEASHLWIEDNDNLGFLKSLVDRGDRYFLVLPLKVKSNVTGMICLGNLEKFEVSEKKLGELRDLADRVAVALSNAEWEDKLYYQAHYDAVTGLPNRYLLKDRLEQSVAKTLRTNNSLAILLIDLDQFKSVNDSMGHKVGDELLIQVGQRISSCVRTSDTLARFGGDEFVIIMDGEDEGETIINQATHLARRIQHQFTTPFIMNKREIYISSSIGISICPDNSETVDDLLKHADSAMYHAKNQGRAQFRFFDQALNENLMHKLELETDLRYALEREELLLLYQPKVAAQQGGKIVGVEVLLRWKHPEKGFISPELFIPIAEETGLIKEIGAWVLRTACDQNQEWVKQGFDNMHISVNLSGVQFRQVNFDQILQQTLEDTKLAPSQLDLEITEGVTIEDFDKTVDLLTRFHNIGVSVSIDDFGTGYSSMSYLKKFNVDKLKIDKSFVDGVPESESSQSIVMAIIALGHSLEFSVVAEGVETREQYDFLVEAGVDEIQGFYISRPLPKEEFEKFYTVHAERLRA